MNQQHFNLRMLTSGLFVLIFQCLYLAAEPQPQNQDTETVPKVDRAYTAKAIDWLGEQLGEVYVFPEVAESMERHIRDQMDKGVYENISHPRDLAEALTSDLQSVSQDKHLRVVFEADPPVDEVSEEERKRRELQGLERRRYENFAFQKVERLSGNVGYLRFDAFMDSSVASETAIAAMNFLAYCDALIVDLRYNNGGSPSMIQLLTSYFFEEPKHLNSFYIRRDDSTRQFWTTGHVKGKKMSDVLLFVLTSQNTFSAAEEFTYNLKSMGRATIVGETTGGGAHPVDFHHNADLQMGILLPFGRAVNPITGTNWEGTGVEPDVKTSREDAFRVAHRMAVEQLLEGAEGGRKRSLTWTSEYLQGLESPAPLEAEILNSLAGMYGPRTISVANGELFYQREGFPRYRIFAISEDLFCLEGEENFRIQIERDGEGKPIALVGVYANGHRDRSPRDPD